MLRESGNRRRDYIPKGLDLENPLSDDGNPHLSASSFDGNRLSRFLEPFNVAADRVLRHFPRMQKVPALSDKAGQGRNGYCVAAMFVGFKECGVFADPGTAILHKRILT
jgi:hypothetical protein